MGSLVSDDSLVPDPITTSPALQTSSRLIIYSTIHYGSISRTIRCLVDTGADDNAMAQSTATELGLALVELSIPITVGLASSSDTNDLTITHCTVPVQLHIGKHVETITFYVVPHLSLPIFLADSWLAKHNPAIDWKMKSITFNSQHCLSECCTDTVTVYSNIPPVLHALPAITTVAGSNLDELSHVMQTTKTK